MSSKCSVSAVSNRSAVSEFFFFSASYNSPRYAASCSVFASFFFNSWISSSCSVTWSCDGCGAFLELESLFFCLLSACDPFAFSEYWSDSCKRPSVIESILRIIKPNCIRTISNSFLRRSVSSSISGISFSSKWSYRESPIPSALVASKHLWINSPSGIASQSG